MDKTGVKEESKKKIIAVILALMPKAKIYIHGSRADGTYKQWSAIDIAIDTGKKMSRFDVAELVDVTSALSIPYRIDILDLQNASPELKNIIEEEKIVWKS